MLSILIGLACIAIIVAFAEPLIAGLLLIGAGALALAGIAIAVIFLLAAAPYLAELVNHVWPFLLFGGVAWLGVSALFRARVEVHSPKSGTREAEKPDERTTGYAVRIATVHPYTGEYEAIGPWVFDLDRIDAVWHNVAANARLLYEDMEEPPMELEFPDLAERSNTARVEMSRQRAGVAVIRVRFNYLRKVAHHSMRRSEHTKETDTYERTPAQVNIWIGPNEACLDMDKVERETRHPLVTNVGVKRRRNGYLAKVV